MLFETLLVIALVPQAPPDEPVWLGAEAVKHVQTGYPILAPKNDPKGGPRDWVIAVLVTAVNESERDRASNTREYQIHYIGLAAGEHDLRDYLQYPEKVNRLMFPPMLVTVSDPLPPGHHGQLETPPVVGREVASPGPLCATFAILAGGWVAGLAVAGLVVWKRAHPRRVRVPTGAGGDGLLKRLRLAEVKLLTPQAVAEIQLELLERWRNELGLERSRGVALVHALKQDTRGRELMAALDAWLLLLESGPAKLPALLEEWSARRAGVPVTEPRAQP